MARRRYRRRADLDSPWWWVGAFFMLYVYLAVLAIWLVWALIALSVAGVAKLARNDDLSRTMIRNLAWTRRRRRPVTARGRR
jgi:hypothetical protein